MAWWDSVTSSVGNYFSSGDGWSDIFSGLMSGIGAAGQASSDKDKAKFDARAAIELVGKQGLEARKTKDFEAQLLDFYERSETMRDRKVALDSYGQFSKIRDYAPNYVRGPDPAAPVKPVVS